MALEKRGELAFSTLEGFPMSTTKLIFGSMLLGACLLASAPAEAFHPRDCCPPPPPKTVILHVCHPCTGCQYDIAVCIPACCEGAPKVCFEKTLIGDGKTVFEWCCGHRVVVRYNHHGYRVIQRD
jgi:hypothetical protein